MYRQRRAKIMTRPGSIAGTSILCIGSLGHMALGLLVLHCL